LLADILKNEPRSLSSHLWPTLADEGRQLLRLLVLPSLSSSTLWADDHLPPGPLDLLALGVARKNLLDARYDARCAYVRIDEAFEDASIRC